MNFLETLKLHLENSPLAAVQWDKEFQVKYWSKQAERIFGWKAEEVMGKHPDEWNFVVEEDRERVAGIIGDLVSGKEPRNVCSNRNYHKTGKLLNCEWYNSVLFNSGEEMQSILSLVLDVTEKVELQQKYDRAQRLENIGLLTGGISHDLNNILAPISLGAELIRNRTDDPKIHDTLKIISRSVERGSTLVRHILSFSKGTTEGNAILSPERILKDVKDMLELGFPKNIRIYRNAERGVWNIEANLTQVHQILINLCINARDSMPKGGELHLSAANITFDDSRDLPGGNRLQPGNYVLFGVKDTGDGIPENIQRKIFDPFFSTKTSKKGTGLGLSNSLELIQNYGGGIEFTSSPKSGTTFFTYLPAVKEQKDPDEPEPEKLPISPGNGETILVVDDEQSIRRILKALLSANGYRPITAADGVIALGKLHEKSKKVQAVITDIDMPNIDGIALVRAIQSMGLKQLPILSFYGSATEKEHKVRQMKKLGVRHFIKKPFDSQSFLSVVDNMLRESSS